MNSSKRIFYFHSFLKGTGNAYCAILPAQPMMERLSYMAIAEQVKRFASRMGIQVKSLKRCMVSIKK